MPRHTYLKRRTGGTLWLRRPIPKDLCARYGKQEHWESLDTKAPAEAARRLRARLVVLDHEFEQARKQRGPLTWRVPTEEELRVCEAK